MDKIEQRVVVTDSQRAAGAGHRVAPGAWRRGRGPARRGRRAQRPPRRPPTPRPRSSGCCRSAAPRSPRCAGRASWSGRASATTSSMSRAATDAGIWVANVPDYCVDEVADHALLLLLSAWRRLTELERVWHAGALGQREPRPAGPPDPRAAPRHRRLRADRACGGAAGARLRLRGRGPRPAGRRRRPPGGRRRAGRARRAVRDERRDHAPRPADARDQVPGRRRASGAGQARRRPRQHQPRRPRRPGRPRSGPRRRTDRGGGPGRAGRRTCSRT